MPQRRQLQCPPRVVFPALRESLHAPISAEAGLPSGNPADLPPQVALLQTRVWEDTRGNPRPGRSLRPGSPVGNAAPVVLRVPGSARTPRCGFPISADLGNRRLFAVNEQPRGTERRGCPRGPSAGRPGSAGEPGETRGNLARPGGTRPARQGRLGQDVGGPRPPPGGLGESREPPAGVGSSYY